MKRGELNMDINIKRENTAIRRNKLSVPFKFLLKNNLLNGTVLDYGCGRGLKESK